MKKVFLALLAICLALTLVSCDAQAILKIGKLMGDMGNNVYGIKPDLEDVNATTTAVDNSVKKQENGEVATVADPVTTLNIDAAVSAELDIVITADTKIAALDFTKTSEIQTKIAEVQSSPQKIAELKTQLAAPIIDATADNAEEQKTAVVNALKVEKAKVVVATNAAVTESVPEAYRSAVTSVLDNINSITIPENPTKADLVTMQIISGLTTDIQTNIDLITSGTGEEKEAAQVALAGSAMTALASLKTISDVSSINVLSGIDISSLMSGSRSLAKSIANAKDADADGIIELPAMTAEQINYLKLCNAFLKQSFDKIGFDANGDLDKAGYEKFIRELTALRLTYEQAAFAIRPFTTSVPDNLLVDENVEYDIGIAGLATFIDNGIGISKSQKFTTNDLGLYLVALIFTTYDEAGKTLMLFNEETMEEVTYSHDFFDDILKPLIKLNPTLASGTVGDDFRLRISTEIQTFFTDLAYTWNSRYFQIALLSTLCGFDVGDFVAKGLVVIPQSLAPVVGNAVNTIVVTAVDSGFGSLVDMLPISSGDTIEDFLMDYVDDFLDGLREEQANL